KNDQELASKEAIQYWQNVDLYVGGSEHATGHLLYSRFWNKFLKDIGIAPEEEFAKKLVNQGMIQGRSNFVYRVKEQSPVTFVSAGLKDQYEVTPLHVDVNIVDQDVLDIEKFKSSRTDVPQDAIFILENDKYICGWEVEKMSKSKFNVVNPDDIVDKYGADTLRLYEMFLGPLTDSKPWNTNGISGTFNFLRKLWRLFYQDQTGKYLVTDEQPTPEELKALHKAIKKVGEDIDALSFNTSVPAFMVLANELTTLKCHKKTILTDFVLILAPFAPHICEELWVVLGNKPGTVTTQSFPTFNPVYLVESTFDYPIQINGKMRVTLTFSADANPKDIEAEVLANEAVQKWLEGKTPKKVVVVPKRIVNVVI
ncbi:MAG: class I tRNA ligase family protein, partial [Siphonobacter sp.]